MQNIITKCCESGYFIFPVKIISTDNDAKPKPLIDDWHKNATNVHLKAASIFKNHEDESIGLVIKNNKYIVIEQSNIPDNKIDVFDFNNTPWTLTQIEFDELPKLFPLKKYMSESNVDTAKPKKKNSKQYLWTTLQIMHKDEAIKDLFCYNQFTSDVEFNKCPPWNPLGAPGSILTDTDMVSLKVYISSKYNFEPATGIIKEAINYEAENIKKHPVQDFIKGLVWDGKARLDSWLVMAAGCEENAYTKAVGRKVLVGAVSRVFAPGCIFQYMLVLEGDQGIGKSRLVSILGGQWFTELNITEEDKDVVEYMRGRWIIEVPEMVCARKNEVDHLKAFITKTKDRVRLAYRHNATDFPRQSIFIGTINPSGDNTYLRDDTGGRRFWPVMCTNIDIQWLKNSREQLFAEAFEVYKHGTEDLHLTDPEAIKISKMHQEERQEEDAWLPYIKDFIDNFPPGNGFTIGEVADKAVGIKKDRLDKWVTIRIGKILKRLEIPQKRVGHDNIRTYFPVQKQIEMAQENAENNW